jgi:hypothetical protein
VCVQLLLYAVVSLQVWSGLVVRVKVRLRVRLSCSWTPQLLGSRTAHTHCTRTAARTTRSPHAVVSLQVIDFSALICFVGLAYLDSKAPNLLVAYTLLTVATLPLDAVTLCMLGHPTSFLQWARSTAYFFILIFKCCSLVLMGMLHTKASIYIYICAHGYAAHVCSWVCCTPRRETPPSHPPPRTTTHAHNVHATHVPPRAYAPTAAAPARTTRPPPPVQLPAIPSARRAAAILTAPRAV